MNSADSHRLPGGKEPAEIELLFRDGIGRWQWRGISIRLLAGALLVLVGWLDWITGWEWSLFVFYAVPIFLVVWYGDRLTAVLVALLCSCIWWLANGSEHPYATGWGYAWAGLSRMAYFLFVAIGGAALRAKRDAEQERVAAMERASELEHEIVRISEEEQRRIGHDLHDGLCQYLAGIKCALGIARHELEVKSIPEYARLMEIEKMLGDAVTQARELARGISPVMSNEAGLAAALEDLANSSAKIYAQPIRFQSEGDVNEYDGKKAHHLYRIAQEALGNALRHSGAAMITIDLSGNETTLTLKVTDDGNGIAEGAANRRGMGLRTMAYRARALGAAEFSIKSSPNGGTVVTCQTSRSGTGEKN